MRTLGEAAPISTTNTFRPSRRSSFTSKPRSWRTGLYASSVYSLQTTIKRSQVTRFVFHSWQIGFLFAAFLLLAGADSLVADDTSSVPPIRVDQPTSEPSPIIESKPPEEVSQEASSEPLELGISVGGPVILNATVGYWARSAPLLARLSGIYLGETRGVELDLGYRFSFWGNDRNYVALSLASWQVSSAFTSWYYIYSQTQEDAFNGIGPSVGFNFNGLSVQVGVLFGQLKSNLSYDAGPSGTGAYGNNSFSVQPGFQIGYSFFL